MKKIPLRTCVVTKEQLPKSELIRIVKTPDGNIVIDTTGKTNGRGAYVKKDENVIKLAASKKLIDKHLETTVPSQIYEDLLKMI